MSFKNGIHFLSAWSGRAGNHLSDLPPLSFLYPCASETMAKPGVSKLIGPAAHTRYGSAILRIIAAQDSFVTIATDPEAENAAKILVLANQPQDFVFSTNHKISWTTA